MDLKHRLLRESFGYASFRPGQQKLIDAMLGGRDVLGVMPTGAGKSICYQIAGMLLPGVTLVVSPLISLMQDQVAALCRAGLPACLLNSAQTAEERRRAVQQVVRGRYKLIYVAPERLIQPDFAQLIGRLPIGMIAVDEAHCISQWGHDFRPSYRKIPQFIRSLPARPVVSAFTATATAQVREDIVQALGLRAPERLVTSFDRPNLYYEVRRTYDREAQLVRFLAPRADTSGIVYCLTRKKTEEMARYLCDNGIRAAAYHAGMEPMARRAVQRDFVGGSVPVLVATNAFGMGIDKPDVRFVVHFGMPRDLESYYQEAGRAGRDGAPAHCLLLFEEADIGLHEYLIGKDPDNPALTDEEVAWLKKRRFARLEQMKRYAFTDQCLRRHILRYFGQDAPDFCGQCGNCEASSVQKDVTVEAQKILSCVYRTEEQCGADLLCRVLHGSEEADIYSAGYHTLSTYGIMRDTPPEEIRAIVSHLISLGYLVRQENPHIRLRLSAEAKQVLFRGARVTMRVRVSQRDARLARAVGQSERPELSRALRKYRQKSAARHGVPPHAVFSDRTLERLVRELPQTEDAVRAVAGADGRASREAKAILRVIQKYCSVYF
ncbi:MAG TPA: DNA helicase RecQ [Candidatus Butyricicoccus stercorigallinarum]|nr:DNA helicase RecQ [Candidatus Butyricicoccus stercorigallinarum]